MMRNWVEVTEVKGGSKVPIFVNLEQVSSMQRLPGDNATKLYFLAGQPEGTVVVEEAPRDILRAASAFVVKVAGGR